MSNLSPENISTKFVKTTGGPILELSPWNAGQSSPGTAATDSSQSWHAYVLRWRAKRTCIHWAQETPTKVLHVICLLCLSDGKTLISCGGIDQAICVWDLMMQRCVRTFGASPQVGYVYILCCRVYCGDFPAFHKHMEAWWFFGVLNFVSRRFDYMLWLFYYLRKLRFPCPGGNPSKTTKLLVATSYLTSLLDCVSKKCDKIRVQILIMFIKWWSRRVGLGLHSWWRSCWGWRNWHGPSRDPCIEAVGSGGRELVRWKLQVYGMFWKLWVCCCIRRNTGHQHFLDRGWPPQYTVVLLPLSVLAGGCWYLHHWFISWLAFSTSSELHLLMYSISTGENGWDACSLRCMTHSPVRRSFRVPLHPINDQEDFCSLYITQYEGCISAIKAFLV